MNMVLRPGEALEWRWSQCDPVKHHGALQTMPTYPSLIYNGLWEYRPDFSKETWRKGASSVENITSGPDGLAAEEGKPGTVIWTLRSPYVFVGGRLEAESAAAQFSISVDGKTWQTVKDNLDKFFSTVGPAHYEYRLKCQWKDPPGSAASRFSTTCRWRPWPCRRWSWAKILSPIPISPLATAKSASRTSGWNGPHHNRLRPRSRELPTRRGEANGTDIVFQWTAAQDPDGDAINDYQFELSSRADMRYPLSLDFYKLISRTADVIKEKGKDGPIIAKAQYTLSQPGLLTPDRKYYWRVRAMDDKGLWGAWSKTWSFIPRGPAYPVNVTLDFDPAKARAFSGGTANSIGRRPAKYRIYGSDEKGFTIADKAYQSTVGITKAEMAAWNPWFPANFIAETTATELAVIGANVELPPPTRPTTASSQWMNKASAAGLPTTRPLLGP
jgi:hypothetical protein